METEPIFASVRNVLKDYTNIEKLPTELEKFTLSSDGFDAKLGLYEISEGLTFLHQTCGIIHRDLSPENLYITKKGDWKIGGFGNSITYKEKNEPSSVLNFETQETHMTIRPLPNLQSVAPESVFLNRYEAASDCFALGCLGWELFHYKPLLGNINSVPQYKQSLERFSMPRSDKVPEILYSQLVTLLSIDPMSRADVKSFLECNYFGDTLLLSIIYLNNLAKKEPASKAQFFKGLIHIIPKFSPKIVLDKVVLTYSRRTEKHSTFSSDFTFGFHTGYFTST